MSAGTSRRTFLVGAGAAGLAGLVAACSGAPPQPPPGAPGPAEPAPTTTPAPAVEWTGDAQAVALCAAISALAADVYDEALAGAGRGAYGTTPPAITTFLTVAREQHTANVEAWNQVLAAAGADEVDGEPLSTAAEVRERLAAARAPVDLAVLAVDLETALAATATSLLAEITHPPAVETAAALAPVAAMRAATASFLAGRPAVPMTDPVAGALGREALTTA